LGENDTKDMNIIRLLEMEDRGTLELFDSLRAKEIHENTARVK
jgi:hypothetical protein